MQLNKLRMSVGSDNFREVITESDILIDKSLFIQEVIDSPAKAMLLTWPRRWGKTLNMDMLKTFLAIEVDEQGVAKVNSNRILFEGGLLGTKGRDGKKLEKLEIANISNGSYIKNHQGAYPVISISFKDITGKSFSEVQEKLILGIKMLYLEYAYLEKSYKLGSHEKADLQKYITGAVSKAELEQSLKLLSKLLYKHHGEKVYVLIDEYDKPVNFLFEANIAQNNQTGLIQDVAQLLTSILSVCGKSNPFLQKIVLTGIFDTLKKEGASGFNNVEAFGITDVRFSKSFGFSENEVNQLISKLGFEEKAVIISKNIKEWYNGYTVPLGEGQTLQVYTPWAVMHYLDKAYNDQVYQPQNYWAKSGASVILQGLLSRGAVSNDLLGKFNLISNDNEVRLKYDSKTSLFDKKVAVGEHEEKVLTYLLINSGYLTLRQEGAEYFFRIPNSEVKSEFLDVVGGLLTYSDVDIKHKDVLLDFLSSLQSKKDIAGILDKIITKDKKGLESLFHGQPLKCEHKSLNFNFIHIAAITGDPDVTKVLLNNCDVKLLSVKDRVSGLKPIDYAYLSKNKETIKLLENVQLSGDKSIKVPGLHESVLCYPVGFLYLFGVCKSYEDFARIDISSGGGFKSLEQFEKYAIVNEHAFVSLVHECKAPYTEIASVRVSLFQGNEYNELILNLCDYAFRDET